MSALVLGERWGPASSGAILPQHRAEFERVVGQDAIDPDLGVKSPIYVEEDAPWSAFRDRDNPYGFVTFDVDPGTAGGSTSMKATYYALRGALGDVTPIDQFTLTRKRNDAV